MLHRETRELLIKAYEKSHNAKDVQKIFEELKMNVIFLPPYSPDFNPIEKMWSKVKAYLRKYKERNISNLNNAINKSISTITFSDCKGWFRSCCLS